jgi:hypothetical protein
MALAAMGWTILAATPARAIVAGQVNTFQDGTTQGWTNGGLVAPPSNVSTGGPAGAGDRYLDDTTTNRLATFNPTWGGNYTAAGVLDLEVDFLNPNPTPLHMRAVLFGPGGGRWTSTVPAIVPADAAWHHYAFSLREADLTQVTLPDTYAAVMASVTQLMFRHDTALSSGGTVFSGSVRLDNVAAVPEPAGLALLALAAAGLPRRRPRR